MMADTACTTTNEFLKDVLAGLRAPQKHLPAKYFYDTAGSRLFDRITTLEEYYPTRVERGVMQRSAKEMARRCGPQCLLIELGAGSLVKVRLLLDHLDDPAGFVPVDVSGPHLQAAAKALSRDYPGLPVVSVCADFTEDFPLPDLPARRRVLFFPGSTLGNFDPHDADDLLRRMARLVGPGGGLLLGVDLRKDVAVLEAAYNDRHGVTAAFNRNLLVRINRELGGDFDVEAFTHRAVFNPQHSRIEMHLVSRERQTVHLGGATFEFRPGETIHTENSHKYDLGELKQRVLPCGWQCQEIWTDERHYFALMFLHAK